MQATMHSLQRTSLYGCQRPSPRRRAMPLSPRAACPRTPYPMALRRYSLSVDAPSTGATGQAAAERRASELLPHQIQQVLIACKGMACTAGRPMTATQAQLLMQATQQQLADSASDPAPEQASGLRFAHVAALYDPDEEHRAEKTLVTQFSLEGRQTLHARGMALCYTVISDQPWRLLLGGADLSVIRQERIRCADIVFPGNCLVQLSLARGMLHGFEGKLAGACAGLVRQRSWGWFGHENRRCDEPAEQGWHAGLLVAVEPVRIMVIADRAIPWQAVRQWQDTVPIEKTEDAIAWEIARMSMPF